MNDVNRRRASVRLRLPIRPLFRQRVGSIEAATEQRIDTLARAVLHGLITHPTASLRQ